MSYTSELPDYLGHDPDTMAQIEELTYTVNLIIAYLKGENHG